MVVKPGNSGVGLSQESAWSEKKNTELWRHLMLYVCKTK